MLYLAIRIPLILIGIPTTSPELFYMLVGERLANGYDMYREVYDNTAPLSALMYWLIDTIIGRSIITYRLMATILLLVQALLLNSIFNRHQVYEEKNYLPALLYLVLGSLTYEFDMLTPLLIGNTFIILSLPYMITVSREGLDNNRLFVGGFMLGLAALSYLPLALFLLVGMFAVIFFASNTFRSFLLMLCGFAFPYVVLMTYYLYTGTLSHFLEMHLLRPWQFGVEFLLPARDLVLILLLPAIILVLSIFSTASLPQRLVFQVKFQQIMWVWLAVSLLVIFTRPQVSAGTFVLVFPPLAYFGQYFFTSGIRKWILHVFFLIVLAGVLVLRYRQPLGIAQIVGIDDSKLQLPAQPAVNFQGASVLVLGHNLSYYINNTPATPYLNWQLSQRHFGNLNEYQAIYKIHQNFREEPPAYIVDEAGLMEELKYKLPSVFEAYQATETAAVYKRVR